MRNFIRTSLRTVGMIFGFGAAGCSADGSAKDKAGSGGEPTTAGGASTSGGTTGSGGNPSTSSTTSSSTTGATNCSNVRPVGTEWDEATCDQWASETEECNNAWMVDNNYCNESCGRCTPTSSGSSTSSTSTSSSTTGGTLTCGSGTTRVGGQQICSNTQGEVGNGYSYEYWSDGSGSGCMTVFSDQAAFSANWSSVGDFLARVGLKYDESRTAD